MPQDSDSRLKDDCQMMVNTECGREPWLWYLRRRTRNAVRKLRRALGFRRAWEHPFDTPHPEVRRPAPIEVNTGDRVRVRSLKEIESTLDANGSCKGCGFLLPMARYCGQEFRVAQRVDRFFDERRWKMLKCKNLILLEGVHCDGSGHPDTQGCQRMCFFFWRTEWVEKIE